MHTRKLGSITRGFKMTTYRRPRNSNSRIDATIRAELHWRQKNKEVIRLLSQGMSTNDISQLTGRPNRGIRQVRERLQES